MNMSLGWRRLLPTLSAITLLSAVCTPTRHVKDPRLDQLQLPPGFHIDIFAEGIENARSMCWGDQGTLFVGTRNAGNVYAVVDLNKDFRADTIYTIAKDLKMPNGVAFREGSLYVAEVSRILRFDQIEANLQHPPQPVVVRDDFPDEEHHGWKYIAFGPDGKLYIPVGAPCNICEHLEEPRFSSIMRMEADGSNPEVFAHGVRNSVGFAWHPDSKELWFTDNGRDWLGDDAPSDELNHAPQPGMHFGYPYCHAGDVPDPEFGKGKDCASYIAPAQKLGAHVAALGILFYTGAMFPPEYQNNILIAEHGSWNRKVPDGYRITRVQLEGNQPKSYAPWATGWLKDGKAWGRPVALLQMPDGSVLVSDDFANLIYRISYTAP